MSGRERLGLPQWGVRANSFGPAAELYDRIRPTYPSEAIGWALAPLGAGAWRIVDIGAGTGIMTRRLLELGHEVLAVEPDEQMRDRLAQTTPAAMPLSGRAEAIPLPDASVDGVVAAQAYHWFDRDLAHNELARVIRPGGVFAAIWNIRDEAEPWVAEYSRIVEGGAFRRPEDAPADPNAPRPPALDFGGSFADTEMATFHHETPHTVETLVRLLQSRSYYIVASAERRGELEAEVRRLVGTHPDLAGRTQFPLRYETVVHRGVRRLR